MLIRKKTKSEFLIKTDKQDMWQCYPRQYNQVHINITVRGNVIRLNIKLGSEHT